MKVQVNRLEEKPNHQHAMNSPRFKDFIRPLRPWTYPLSLIPMLLAACLIYKQGDSIDLPLFLLMVITVLFIHASAIVTNTYFDYINGVDGPNSYDTSLVDGILTTTHILRMTAVSIGGSVLGITSVVAMSPARIEHVLAVYIFFGMIALNYTGGLGLKYIAMGEFATVSVRTGALVAIYVSQGVTVSWIPVLYLLPTTSLSMTVMLSNNIRDMVSDAKAGFTTLPLQIGKRWASVLFTVLLLVIPFTAVCALAVAASAWFLMPLLTMVPAFKCWRRFYYGQLQKLPGIIATSICLPFGLLYLAACGLTSGEQLPGFGI